MREPARAAVPAVAGSPPKWLAGLDGIRGLAALYVVVNHIFLRAFPGYPAARAPFWAGWFIYGRFAVVVFIVLSGFSLALSPARHGWRLDSLSRFAHRRIRRIVPAYWAALVFSLAVAWLIVLTLESTVTSPDSKRAPTSPRFTEEISFLKRQLVKPRLGIRRDIAVWPPSKPGLGMPWWPVRAFWPFWPLPEVLCRPEP